VKREQFLRQVMQQTGARDEREADEFARSVLLALADDLPRDEAHDMASQLPKEMRSYVTGRLSHGGPIQHMDMATFADRIQRDLALDTPEQAQQVTRGVFAVLKAAISPGELEDVQAELSPSLREALQRS
jgi:uncharacterized protein (DUF2267 family)